MKIQRFTTEQEITISFEDLSLNAIIEIPEEATGLVIFAHGSGSGRQSPRNLHVARTLNGAGFGTVLMDLLTQDEEAVDEQTLEYRFDIDLLADRIVHVTDWLLNNLESHFSIGYFGASTGAAAALVAAAQRPDVVSAIVSRGGRADLAEPVLHLIKIPTLLIVGGNDTAVIGMNEYAAKLLAGPKHIAIVAGATHLFEEKGKLDEVAQLASEWFTKYLIQTDR
jgi:pimeloyl-ACP methyl ester carboxylesterase